MMLNIWCVASIVIVFYHYEAVTSGNIVARNKPSDEEFSSADDVLRKLSFNFSSSGWIANEINDQLITFKLPTEKDEKMESFVHKLFPDFSFDTVTSIIGNEPDISFQDLLLENITINAAIKEVSIGTRLTASVVVIPELVEVQDVTLVLRMAFKFSIEPPTFQSLEMAARWPVGTTNFEFYLSTSGSEVLCSANLENPTSNVLEVKNSMDFLGLSFIPKETIIDSSNLEKLKLKYVQVNGSYKKNGNFELFFSGFPSLDGWKNLHEARLVITRYTKEEFTHTAVTTALTFNTIKLSDVIYKATGVDIRDVPALGTTQPSKTTIFISTDDGMSDVNFDLSDKDYKNTTSNRNGLTVQFGLSFKQAEASTLFFAYFSFGKLVFKPAGIHSSLNFENLVYLFFSDISVDRQNLQLPPGVSSILHLQVSHFNVSTTTGVKTLSVNLKFDEPIDILPGYIRMHNTSLYFNTTFSKPRRTAVTAVGVCTIGSYLVQFSIEPLLALDGVAAGSIVNSLQGYVVRGYTKILNIGDLLSTLHADSHLSQVSFISLDKLKLTNVKLIGMYNKSNAWALGLSAVPSLKCWDSLVSTHFLITSDIKEHTAQTMFTELQQFKSLKLSLLIKIAIGVDLNDVPFLGTLEASNVEFVMSTGDVSPHLQPQLLDGSMARMADVRKGMTVQADLNLTEDEAPHKFLIHLSPDWIKVRPRIIGRSFNLQSLLKVTIPDLSVDSLSLPPEIENIGIAEVSSFDIRIMSGIKILLVNLTIQDSFDIIPGYLTINTSSLLIKTTFNKPRKSTFAISGTWTIGSNSIDVYLETTSKFNVGSTKSLKWQGLTYVLRGYAKTIDFASLLTKMDVKYVMNQMSTIDFDDMRLDDIKLRGWYVKDETVVIGLTADASISGWQFLSDSQIVLTSNLNEQKARTVLTTALRLDALKLSDLIRKISDVDISSYPFVGSVHLSNIRLFNSSADLELNPLHKLIGGNLKNVTEIRKDVTIVGDLSLVSTRTYSIRLSKGMIRFDRFISSSTLKLIELIKVTIPDFLTNDFQVLWNASILADFHHMTVSGFGFNICEKLLCVSVTFEQSTFFVDKIVGLELKIFTLSINTTLSKPRKLAFKANGLLRLGPLRINISMSSAARIDENSYVLDQNEFHGYAKCIDFIEMDSRLFSTTNHDLFYVPLDKLKLHDVKVMGVYNKGKSLAVGISTIAFLKDWDMLVGVNYTYTVDLDGKPIRPSSIRDLFPMSSIKLTYLVKKNISDDNILDVPVVGPLQASNVKTVASTHDFSMSLIHNYFTRVANYDLIWKKSFTIKVYLKILKDETRHPFTIRLSPKLFSFISLGRGLNLQSLLKVIIPDLSIDSLSLPPGIDNIGKLEVSSFDISIMSGTKILVAYLRIKDSVDIIPGYLQINNSSPFINSTFKKPRESTFAISGTWSIGSNSIDILLYAVAENNVVFDERSTWQGLAYVLRGGANKIDVGEVLNKLNVEAVVNQMSVYNFDDMKLNDVKLMGRYVKDKAVAIALSSANSSILDWQSVSDMYSYVLLTRYFNSHKPRAVVTITIQLQSLRLSDLTKKAFEVDITNLPFVGSVQLHDVELFFSSSDVALNSFTILLDGFLTTIQVVRKGVTVVADIRLSSGQALQRYVMQVSGKLISFQPNVSVNVVSFREIVDITIPDFSIDELQLPPAISDVLDLHVSGFGFSIQQKSLFVDMTIPGSFEFIPGYVDIANVSLSMSATFKKPRKSTIKVSGKWQIGSTCTDVVIKPELQTPLGRFVVSAYSEKISVTDILDHFKAEFLPDEISDILNRSGMLEFIILKPNISVPLDVRKFILRMSGTSKIGGWPTVELTSAVIHNEGISKFVAGFDFSNIKFSNLIETLTGVDVSDIAFLNEIVKCAVIISPGTIPDFIFDGATLSRLSIHRGVSLTAELPFPESCGGEKICTFAKETVGKDALLPLTATISSPKQFSLIAALSDIKLIDGLTLKQCGLEFALGIKTYVDIKASLSLNNPPLTFTGAISNGRQGLELYMAMEGVWKRAFGINYLAFGNAILSLMLPIETPGIQISGEMRIGRLDSGRELIAKVYVGIEPKMVRRNYFHGFIDHATIRKILDAFDFDVPLPPILQDSSLPHGLETSFAFVDIELPGIVIHKGFKLNGTLTTMGFNLSAFITILSKAIKIHVRLPSLAVVGGLMNVTASHTDSSEGPKLVADIKMLPIPFVNVTGTGYFKLNSGDFNIEGEVYLQITDKQYIFFATGKWFWFETTLKISAPYGSIERASYRVSCDVSTAGMAKLLEESVDVIREISLGMNAMLNDAIDEVNNNMVDYNSTITDKIVASICSIEECNQGIVFNKQA